MPLLIWCPEAYHHNDSVELGTNRYIGILTYMVKAGEAYTKKRAVLRELNETFSHLSPNAMLWFNKNRNDIDPVESLESKIKQLKIE